MNLIAKHMPAEWEQHTATWLAWPYDPITFPQRIEKVEKVFTSIIYYLHQNELINLLVLDKTMKQKTIKIFKANNINLNKIIFHIVDYADVWIRDYAPIFLTDKNKLTCVKWKYNAYGNKFPELLKDDQVFYKIKVNYPMLEANIIMEAGAIDVNGHDTLITTEECLLNPNRNPNLNKQQTEDYLKRYLGVTKIIWLTKGIINDHTDGHIDEVARFVNKDTIIYAYEENPNDPNFEILNNNFHTLQDYNQFNLVKLPMPKMTYDNGKKAPVSYANFYIANKIILVPQFKHKNDKPVLEIIQSQFPNRKAIGIDCTDLIYGGGTIHCITQQQPS
jgi:agmatine deiminase